MGIGRKFGRLAQFIGLGHNLGIALYGEQNVALQRVCYSRCRGDFVSLFLGLVKNGVNADDGILDISSGLAFGLGKVISIKNIVGNAITL